MTEEDVHYSAVSTLYDAVQNTTPVYATIDDNTTPETVAYDYATPAGYSNIPDTVVCDNAGYSNNAIPARYSNIPTVVCDNGTPAGYSNVSDTVVCDNATPVLASEGTGIGYTQ